MSVRTEARPRPADNGRVSPDELLARRPDRSWSQEVWVGVFVIVGVIAGLSALFALTDAADFRGRDIILTMVADAGGLRNGDPVRMRGVDVGRVNGREDRKVLGPEYGGDGTIQGRCTAMELPIHTFPAHWAPNTLLFYSGTQFPGRYREGAFVAFHGGFNRPDPFRDEGFNVTFVRFRDGLPSHGDEVFADGFIGEDAEELPRDADHRPTGLAQGPDGSLYITDDRGGRIWRVLHMSRR